MPRQWSIRAESNHRHFVNVPRIITDKQIPDFDFDANLMCSLRLQLRLYCSNLLKTDKTFVLLYKEMYYRHILANPKAHQTLTLEQRQASFQTYIELFDFLLSTPS
jgi:hypothetical protein